MAMINTGGPKIGDMREATHTAQDPLSRKLEIYTPQGWKDQEGMLGKTREDSKIYGDQLASTLYPGTIKIDLTKEQDLIQILIDQAKSQGIKEGELIINIIREHYSNIDNIIDDI